MPGRSGEFLDFGQAYRKAADYCALQDRCISEMKLKLRIWNIDKEFYNKIISSLIDEDFLNEKRFALNYAGGKFRIKGWGKHKIAAGLRARNIPTLFVQQALSSINSAQYLITLETLIQKKLRLLGGDTEINRQKAAYFAASRGFESGLIASLIRDTEIFDF
jgi:regulatory protein